MATGMEWSCPICCNALDDVAYTMPCRHQFCLVCILRWLRGNRTCPLCRTLISGISFSELAEDCLECVIGHPAVSPDATSRAGNAPDSCDGPGASSSQQTLSPDEQETAGPEAVGGLLPELWAEIFRTHQNLLDPVRSWLQEGLEEIYRDQWWQIKTAESGILLALCTFGPDREVLVRRLQSRLKQHTAQLVHGILSIIEIRCSEEVRRLRSSHAPGERSQNPRNSSDSAAFQRRAPTPDSSAEDALWGSLSRPTQP